MERSQQRRHEEKEQRREAIIDAAEQVLATSDFDSARMEEVAKVARVSRALVYLYFKNKQELDLAICVRALRALRQHFVDSAARHATGYAKVASLGHTYIQFAKDFPVYFAVLSRFESHPFDTLEPSSTELAVFEAGSAVHAVTVECLQIGMRDGSIRADLEQPLSAALSLWAFVHGLIQIAHNKQHFLEQVGIPPTQYTDYAIDLVMRGLRPVAGTRAPSDA
ncbi:TetR/AcrR family transcriptional regulator [Sinimarinibacterium sp. CAU 1509]|uniref:TetR/AcrR family transcriptional regulator n=1 Tax=Sinimarinibacterium sp. CAU 1509 TaxID=2562283 RepID=UPI00200A674F|nr:TetR/AcrR family transcriptional regulator [Sinimarinibacterium sp. CAU 1509]